MESSPSCPIKKTMEGRPNPALTAISSRTPSPVSWWHHHCLTAETMHEWIAIQRFSTVRKGGIPMTCMRCSGLMVVDHLLDMQESSVPMWTRGLRCVTCGNIEDPLINHHRIVQRTRRANRLATRLALAKKALQQAAASSDSELPYRGFAQGKNFWWRSARRRLTAINRQGR